MLLFLLVACTTPACGEPEVSTDQPPIAFAGYDEVRRLELEEGGRPRPVRIVLDGTRSFDPDDPHQPLRYRWHQATGPRPVQPLDPAAKQQVVELSEPALYVFVLVVSSGGLDSEPDAVNLLLLPGETNTPPVPVLRYRPSFPVVGQPVLLDGSGSHDPDADDQIVAWLWKLSEPDDVQRPLAGEEESSFTPQLPGAYLVSLTVTDSHGADASILQEISVLPCTPTGPEVCNGLDDDCDGERDEDFDLDGDGHTSCEDDCDDTNPAIHGAAREVCDGLDNDCDSQTDEGFDNDNDGVTSCGGDCNDGDPAVRPGAAEWCNGRDDDCDGIIDEGFDRDEDGYTLCGGDCNDIDPAVHPGRPDPCNGIDDDCDGMDGVDEDGDGYSVCDEPGCDDEPLRNPGVVEIPGNGIDEDCDGSDGVPHCPDADDDGWCGFLAGCDPVADGCAPQWDCNDRLATVHPGAEETCDLVDNDCDGEVDEGWDRDEDGLTSCRGDCDDEDPEVSPALPEVCDGKDNNCNGRVDEGFDENVNGIADCLECVHPELGQPCNERGCTPGAWTCALLPEGLSVVCEPVVRLVDTLGCGTFVRDSDATYVADAEGRLALAGPDELRLQYDPRLGSGAFLIEGERTNHVKQSEALALAPWWHVWGGNLGVDEEDVLLAPDGEPALRYHFSAGNQALYQRDLVDRRGATLSYSLYLRRIDAAFQLQLEEEGNVRLGLWLAAASWERVSAVKSYDQEADGWARVVLRHLPLNPGIAEGEVALWGVQVEEGPFISSYIPTTDQAATRREDRVSFSADLLEPTRGTIALWLRPLYPASTTAAGLRIVEVEGLLRCDWSGGQQQQIVCSAGGASVLIGAPGFPSSSWTFFAVTWDAAAGLAVHSGWQQLESASRGQPLELAAPRGDVVHPLPLYALSRDVRIYARALSAEELRVMFENERGGY